MRSEHFEEFSIIRWQIQTQIRDDVVADIEHALDRKLEVSFREPGRAKPQLVVSSAEHVAELTTPSAPPARWLSAQPPLLCEEGNGPPLKTCTSARLGSRAC